MKKQIWLDINEINKIDWVKKYNNACKNWIKETPDKISLEYSYFTLNEHKKFISEICKKINVKLSGVGLEIGSGPGILSNSLVKIFDNIENIYLLEMVPETFGLMKKIADYNGTSPKLSCIIGDFNRTKFQNNSVDFVVGFDSIHHSENFDLTFKEISRILKPNGILLCFDRGQPNYISNSQIEAMLDIEYSKKYKIENNMDINKKFTRRMNGEHEPLLKNWINTGNKYNFSCEVFIFHKKNLKNFIKACYGLFIPFWLKKRFKKGINITTHFQIILNYLYIKKLNNIKLFSLDYKPKYHRSPNGKMIFLFKKTQ